MKKIIGSFDSESGKVKNYSIQKYGNYYIVIFNTLKSFETPERRIYAVYDLNEKQIAIVDSNIGRIETLDENRFVYIIKNFENDDYTLKIFDIKNRNALRVFSDKEELMYKSNSVLLEKELIVICNNGRQYLYDFVNDKILSYGFSSIDFTDCGFLEISDNLPKDCGACFVVLDIYSDDELPIVSKETLFGYIDLSGHLINGLIGLRHRSITFTSKKGINDLEKSIKIKLNAESLERQKYEEEYSKNIKILRANLKLRIK